MVDLRCRCTRGTQGTACVFEAEKAYVRVCVCVCVFVCVCVCLMCVFVQWVMIFDLAISPSVFKMHRTGQRERLT